MRWERPATALATFDGPARAVRAAVDAREAVRPLGLEIRAGVHTGEVEVVEATSRGSPCTRARGSGARAPSEVLVSSTVKDLVAGSGIEFDERGEHELKGVPGTWRLYAVRSPETRYTRSGAVNIAYQVVGDGPFDLIWVPGWISNVEASWEIPEYAHFLDRLASFSRLILFDKRGTGLSDPVAVDRLPSLEQRMDDVRAVLDAAGSIGPPCSAHQRAEISASSSLRHIRLAFGRSSCSQHSPSGYGARIIPGHPPRETETV